MCVVLCCVVLCCVVLLRVVCRCVLVRCVLLSDSLVYNSKTKRSNMQDSPPLFVYMPSTDLFGGIVLLLDLSTLRKTLCSI
jgi:hypothetical protein